MGKKRRMILIAGLVMSAASCASAAAIMTGCHQEAPKVEVIGVYYDETNDCLVELNGADFTFKLTMAGNEQTGEYSYDGTKFELMLDGGWVVGSLDQAMGVMTFAYNGKSCTLYKTQLQTLSFNTDGGNAVASQSIVKGKKGVRPANPEKNGYIFIDWYDSNTYNKLFDFSADVTEDKTAYARFVKVETSKTAYTVKFDAGEGATCDVTEETTVNGTLYKLPVPVKSGATFVGWWASDYQDATKLTAQYKAEQQISQDLTLFAVWKSDAPAVSVTAEGITWTGGTSGLSYDVTVKLPNGEEKKQSVGSTSFDSYDRTQTGVYEVTVSQNGTTAKAYYINKLLSRVSAFKVEGGKLKFAAVENAQKYLITVTCGDPQHEHTDYDLGTATEYDFSGCAMTEGGIKFVVKAVADGYVTSTSAEYKYEKSLDDLTGLTVNKANDLVKWNAVKNATSYVVEITQGNETQQFTVVSASEGFSVKSFSGKIGIKVYAVAHGYNNSKAAECEYNKGLSTPADLKLKDGATVVWSAVAGAQGYIVKIGSETVETTETSYTLTDAQLALGQISVTVTAKGADSAQNSLESEALTIDGTAMSALPVYENGVLSWNPVLTAKKYVIKVNDGEPIEVDAGECSYEVALEKSGENKIAVNFYNAENVLSADWKEITVNAVSLSFYEDADAEAKEVYVVSGNALALPKPAKSGYAFAGWYDKADGAHNGGKKYSNGTVWEADSDLYAYWVAESYDVTLVVEGGTMDAPTLVNIKYDENFTLPVPVSDDANKVFGGWFTEVNGAGRKYTGRDGVSLSAWLEDREDVKLYAGWLYVLEYKETTGGYSVKAGAGFNYVTDVKIPKEYNGKPVLEIAGSAFLDCDNLISLSIPNTITSIFVGSKGNDSEGSAFQGCDKLQKVTVYDAGAKEPVYFDENGVLCFKNSVTSNTEIKYFPHAYIEANGGDYTVPDSVTALPEKIFMKLKLVNVTIPASVKVINQQAFSECTRLEKIEFLATPEGQESVPLEVHTKAFEMCKKLTEVSFPSRLKVFKTDVFTECKKLVNININGTDSPYTSIDGIVVTADKRTIVYCPLGRTEVTIASTVNTIGEKAFAGCENITSIVIPGNVSLIENEAFLNCTGITTLTLEDAANGTLAVKDNAFKNCKLITSVVLPSQLKKMGAGAFGVGDSNHLVDVVVNCAVPDAEYASGAFVNISTSFVKSVTIGDSVPKMDVAGIFGGSRLESVTVGANNPNFTSIEGVLFDKAKDESGNNIVTEILYYPTNRPGNYSIPSTVKRIGDKVFSGKTGITEITINKNITYIGKNAFEGCSKLQTVIFEDGGTENLTIEESAFNNCTTLVNIALPARTQSIGDYAFAGCDDLVTFVIPEGVESIGDYVFSNCDLLESVSIPSTAVKIGTYVKETDSITGEEVDKFVSVNLFNSKDIGVTSISSFHVSRNLKSVTVAEANPNFASVDGVFYRKDYIDENDKSKGMAITELIYCPTMKSGVVDIPSSVKKIHDYAFVLNSALTEIKFSNGIDGSLELGNRCFYGSTALRKVSLPIGLSTIGENMFENCYALEEVSVPYTVTLIGAKAFTNCRELTTLTFEETPEDKAPVQLVIADGKYYPASGPAGESFYGVFINCGKLQTITLPERTSTIGSYAFATLSGLTTVNLPKSVTSIKEGAFQKCKSLSAVNYAEGGTGDLTIGNSAFAETALTKVELPERCTVIGTKAFQSIKKLQSVYIPSTVKEIKEFAFAALTSSSAPLQRVEFASNSNLEKLGENAFKEQANLNSVNLEVCEKLTAIGGCAFIGCTSLTEIIIPSHVQTLGLAIYTKYGINSSYGVFSGCTSLASVTLATREVEITAADGTVGKEQQSDLRAIQERSFKGTAITELNFPVSTNADGIVLGINLFENCKKLTSVYLSRSVKSISNVFAKCGSIKSITIAPDSENFKNHASQPLILNVEGTAIRYSYGALPADEGTYRIPEGFTEIGARSFEGQSKITKIIIPASVQLIEDAAFINCRSLREVVFEDASNSRLNEIGNQAFMSCPQLVSITIPDRCSKIGEQAFAGCMSLTEATLPKSLKRIGKETFKLCTALTTVNLRGLYPDAYSATVGVEKYVPESIKDPETGKYVFNVGAKIFDSCTALTTVNVSEGVKTFGKNMFYKCTALKTIKLPESFVQFGEKTFELSGLESIEIPAGFENLYYSSSASAPTATSGSSSVFLNCKNLKSVTLPYTIKHIGTYAFQGCESLTTVNYRDESGKIVGEEGKVTLPASITKLASGIFQGCGITSFDLSAYDDYNNLGENIFKNCINLTSVTLSDELTQLKTGMFEGCESLASIKLPSKVTFLGKNTFKNSGLTSIELPSTMTAIGDAVKPSYSRAAETFMGCDKLTTVILPSGLTLISANVFMDCSSLNTVQYRDGEKLVGEVGKFTLPDTVTQIGAKCFRNCGFTELSFDRKITGWGSEVFAANEKLTTVSFSGTANAASSMFLDCAALKTVTFDSAMTKFTMGGSMFKNCTALEEIDLSMASAYGSYMFEGCTKLSSVKLGSVTKIAGSMFKMCSSLESIDLTGVKTFDSSCFEESGLKRVTIPETVTAPSSKMFFNCKNLTSVTLPSKLASIQENMFGGCTSLESVTIPDSVTKIMAKAFDGTAIKSIVIPAKVTSVLNTSFANCSALTQIEVAEGNTAYGLDTNGALIQLSNNTMVAYPLGKAADLDLSGMTKIAKEQFKGFSGSETLVIPEGVTEIGDMAFYGSTIKSVVFPSTLVSIGKSAFENTGLISIDLPEGLTTIGDLAFAHTKLTSVALPTTLTSVPTSATIYNPEDGKTDKSNSPFFGCYGITSITLPEGLTVLGAAMFAHLPELTEVTIPSTITKYSSYVFAKCPKLSKVNFAEGLTVLGQDMFNYCPALKQVNVPDSVEKMPYTFRYSGLESFKYPASFDETSNRPVEGCAELVSVVLPEGLTKLVNMSFKDCTKLKNVTLPSTLNSIESDAFKNCTSLETLVIPESVTDIGATAFIGCTSLKNLVIPSSVVKVSASSTGLFEGWTKDQTVTIMCEPWELGLEWDMAWYVNSEAKFKFVCEDDEVK